MALTKKQALRLYMLWCAYVQIIRAPWGSPKGQENHAQKERGRKRQACNAGCLSVHSSHSLHHSSHCWSQFPSSLSSHCRMSFSLKSVLSLILIFSLFGPQVRLHHSLALCIHAPTGLPAAPGHQRCSSRPCMCVCDHCLQVAVCGCTHVHLACGACAFLQT